MALLSSQHRELATPHQKKVQTKQDAEAPHPYARRVHTERSVIDRVEGALPGRKRIELPAFDSRYDVPVT